MRVLIACEYSGIVRDAFFNRGFDAMSCDLLPSDSPGKHYQGNVFDILLDGWDLLIAHPPCTYLTYCYQLNHYFKPRMEKRELAKDFFMRLYNAPIPYIAIENPVGWMNSIFRKPDQIVRPYYFGENSYKNVCLWLRNLPLLKYDIFEKPKNLKYIVSSISGWEEDYGKKRSLFFYSIAKAMAEQWGEYIK